MGRSGYTDDFDDDPLALGRWRGRVASALRGSRGQKFLCDLRNALDAMPEKRLVTEDLVTPDGDVCSLGCLAVAKSISDISDVDPEDHDRLAKMFDVATCLIQEVEYENDDGGWKETEDQRWTRMRKWCDRHIRSESPTATTQD